MVKNPHSLYQQNNVMLASKPELTLRLYEGGARFLGQAKVAIENKDFAKANELIIKTQDIVAELQATLDFNYEISTNFNLLYDYFLRRLIEANVKKDPEIVSEIAGYLLEFRDTWKQAIEVARAQGFQG